MTTPTHIAVVVMANNGTRIGVAEGSAEAMHRLLHDTIAYDGKTVTINRWLSTTKGGHINLAHVAILDVYPADVFDRLPEESRFRAY